jgi:hypothetical protein
VGEIRFRKVIHRIGRPGLRKNDTERDSDIGGIQTPTDLSRGNWPAHRLSDLRGALKRSLSGRPTCVRDQFWCEVERFILSRWRRAAISAHEAVTLSERERDRDVCFWLSVVPVVYTKARRAAASPWNQRRERRAAASTSEPDRPAACLNSRPKPRTVSTQFDRVSPSRSTIGAR